MSVPVAPIDCTGDAAINCNGDLARQVESLVNLSLSPNTRRAYTADLADFRMYGGGVPSTPEVIAGYLAVLSTRCAVATVQRRLATLSRAHDGLLAENPAKSALVRATMRGIRRSRGVAQRHARPLLKEDLFAALDAMGGSDPKAMRDRCLLLVGFAGAFRRSELVGLDVADVEDVRQGMVLTLRHSKTDQDGQGRQIGIPFGRTQWCPVKALEGWLEVSGTTSGPIFRSMRPDGAWSSARLSPEAVSFVVKSAVARIGHDPRLYSGHSLRAGLATSAAIAGVSAWKIRQQTGHASDAMLARYIRPTELFEGNAVGLVL